LTGLLIALASSGIAGAALAQDDSDGGSDGGLAADSAESQAPAADEEVPAEVTCPDGGSAASAGSCATAAPQTRVQQTPAQQTEAEPPDPFAIQPGEFPQDTPLIVTGTNKTPKAGGMH
jgi:hypothetical protein